MNYQAIKEALMPTAAPTNALALITTQAGMDQTSAQALIDAFLPLFVQTEDAVADGNLITVTSVEDKEGMKRARAARFALRDIRLQAEQNRKTFKENALRTGQAIDKIAGLIKDKIEPVEKRLKEQEEYAERVEAERKAKLAEDRAAKLRAVNADPSMYPLGEMADEAFGNILEGATLAHQKRLADAAAAEEQKKQAEAARQEEVRKANAAAAAARAEAENLRKEQAAKDEAARKDKEAAEAVTRQALAAKQRAENELADQRAEQQRQADAAAEAERRAAAAPDKAKLLTMAKLIRAVPVPQVHSAEAAVITTKAREWIVKLAERIEADAAKL